MVIKGKEAPMLYVRARLKRVIIRSPLQNLEVIPHESLLVPLRTIPSTLQNNYGIYSSNILSSNFCKFKKSKEAPSRG